MADSNQNRTDDNVVDFSKAKSEKKALSAEDQRLHPRRDSTDRLFTQVVLSGDAPDLIGTTLSCKAVNLSVGGIQFRADRSVPTGALLDLWVDVASRPGKFFLSGEVRWTRPVADDSGDQEWYVGVQLKSGAATDILDWRDYQTAAAVR